MEKTLVACIEEAALNAWPAIRQMEYDGWTLRMTGGPSKRVNSVNVHGASRLALAEKIRYCETLYQREGLSLIFRLPESLSPPSLSAELEDDGYHAFDPTLVLGRAVGPDLGAPHEMDIRHLEPLDWLEARAWMMGVPLSALGYHAEILPLILPSKALLCLFADGLPAACGMGVTQGDLLGYFSIYTRPSLRRQGYGKAVMAALTVWGRDHGARFSYLQVEGDNQPAQEMYDRLGFERVYGYEYRKKMG